MLLLGGRRPRDRGPGVPPWEEPADWWVESTPPGQTVLDTAMRLSNWIGSLNDIVALHDVLAYWQSVIDPVRPPLPPRDSGDDEMQRYRHAITPIASGGALLRVGPYVVKLLKEHDARCAAGASGPTTSLGDLVPVRPTSLRTPHHPPCHHRARHPADATANASAPNSSSPPPPPPPTLTPLSTTIAPPHHCTRRFGRRYLWPPGTLGWPPRVLTPPVVLQADVLDAIQQQVTLWSAPKPTSPGQIETESQVAARLLQRWQEFKYMEAVFTMAPGQIVEVRAEPRPRGWGLDGDGRRG